jgi:signal peptidase I
MKFARILFKLSKKLPILGYLLLFSLGLFFIRSFLFQIISVSGNSMLPNFKNGSLLFVTKIGFPKRIPFFDTILEEDSLPISRLDVILFENLERDWVIKRVIGIPGDFYAFRDDKIFIDSVDYDLDIKQRTKPPKDLYLPVELFQNDFFPLQKSGRIPPGYYLLLGDNRENSTDSRDYGLVPSIRIRGKVVKTFDPSLAH